jgi:integrase
MSYAERRKGVLTGRWIGERLIKGERVRFRADTKANADKWEAVVDATGSAPLDGTGSASKHSLGAIAKEARARRKGWKGSHDTSLDQRLEVVLTFFKPQSRPESVTNERLYDFVAELEQRKGRDGGPLSSKTINRYLAVVSGLLDFARENGWTAHAPSIPWQEELEGRFEYFSQEQENALLLVLDPAEANCLRILTKTALRPSEFFDLSSDRVDVTDNQSAWIRLTGIDTKTGKTRSQPLRDFDLARWLKRVLEAGELPSHSDFYYALKDACAALGYSDKLTVYSTRHTALTRLARKAKPAVVQHYAGHSSYKTTLKYIHLNDDDLMEAAGALG